MKINPPIHSAATRFHRLAARGTQGEDGAQPLGSVRATRYQHRPDGKRENVRIQPKGPVADVIRIEPLLELEVGVTAVRDLPVARQPGQDALPEGAEFRGEAFQVITGERSGADQAHFALQDVPELRELIQARLTEQAADAGQYSGVVPELEKAVPVLPVGGIPGKITFEQTVGVRVHRAKLPDRDFPAAVTFAFLSIERTSRA